MPPLEKHSARQMDLKMVVLTMIKANTLLKIRIILLTGSRSKNKLEKVRLVKFLKHWIIKQVQ